MVRPRITSLILLLWIGAVAGACQSTSADDVMSSAGRLPGDRAHPPHSADEGRWLRLHGLYAGAFATDPASHACAIDVLGPQPRLRFDHQASMDLAALLQATEVNGPALRDAEISYSAEGSVGPDSYLSFSDDFDYVFRPSAETRASFVDSTCAERVDADWYKTWSC